MEKRLLRILPAYYFIYLILIFLLLIKNVGIKFKTLLFVFFLQNFSYPHPLFFVEAWSLSIEFWFYILFPLFVFILKGYLKLSDKNSILNSIIFFLLFGFLFRWFRESQMIEIDLFTLDSLFRKQVLTRIDSITYGVLGAFIFRYYNSFWNKYKYLFLILGIIIFTYTKYPILSTGKFYNAVVLYSLQSISMLLFLPFFSNIKNGSGAVFKFVSKISYISYSIYLINLSLVYFNILEKIIFHSISGNYLLLTKYFLFLTISYFGAILMYKYVELPFINKYKKIK